MRTTIFATAFAAVALIASAPAFAQAPRSVTIPSVSVEVKPNSTYTFSLEQAAVVGGGAVAGFVVGRMLFMGHLGPIVVGAAGGYLANMWYTNR